MTLAMHFKKKHTSNIINTNMDEIREEIEELEYKIDYYKDHMQCFDPEGEYYIEYQELVERLEDRLEYLYELLQ